jgi:hypothetical protein
LFVQCDKPGGEQIWNVIAFNDPLYGPAVHNQVHIEADLHTRFDNPDQSANPKKRQDVYSLSKYCPSFEACS